MRYGHPQLQLAMYVYQSEKSIRLAENETDTDEGHPGIPAVITSDALEHTSVVLFHQALEELGARLDVEVLRSNT